MKHQQKKKNLSEPLQGPLLPPTTQAPHRWFRTCSVSQETNAKWGGFWCSEWDQGTGSGNQTQHQAGLKKQHAFSHCRMDARRGTGANAILRPGRGMASAL